MMFDIEYSKQSVKFLKKIDKSVARRILEKIENLRENPALHDSKTIQGHSGLFRVRVGNYRILYEVDHYGEIIGVVKIDKRSRVYR